MCLHMPPFIDMWNKSYLISLAKSANSTDESMGKLQMNPDVDNSDCPVAWPLTHCFWWPARKYVEISSGDVFWKCLVRIFGHVASEMIVTYSWFCFLLAADMHISEKPKTRSLSVSAWIDAWIEVFLWESLTWISAVSSPANCKNLGFVYECKAPFLMVTLVDELLGTRIHPT